MELTAFLKKIAELEGVEITGSALETIAREADGSVRDGLSLLDQIFSFGGSKVTDKEIGQVLGLVDNRIFARLAGALLNRDLGVSLELLNDCYNQGMDLKRFSYTLLYFFRSLLVCKASKQPLAILDVADQELALLQDISKQHSVETLTNIFHLLLKGVEEIQYSSHPRMALEMTFVKAVQVGEIVPVSSLLARLDSMLEGRFDETSDSGPEGMPTGPIPGRGLP